MPKNHRQIPLTQEESAAIAATVDADHAKLESAGLSEIDCCAKCHFWKITSKTSDTGLCRALPPTRSAFNEMSSTTGHPSTSGDDWCGTFKDKTL